MPAIYFGLLVSEPLNAPEKYSATLKEILNYLETRKDQLILT